MVQVLGLVQASAALSLKYMEKNLGPSSTAFPAGSEVKQLELELVLLCYSSTSDGGLSYCETLPGPIKS